MEMTVTKKRHNAFTIIELLVAMGLMVVMIGLSASVFQMAVKAHRRASAASEIMRNLQALTKQLDEDFRGLRKDGEIYVIYEPKVAVDGNGDFVDLNSDGSPDRAERFDRIMFFANGDFQSYGPDDNTGTIIRGNTARISYQWAVDPDGNTVRNQLPGNRILLRTQHIECFDMALDPFLYAPNPPYNITGSYNLSNFADDNLLYEYQMITIGQWLNIPKTDKIQMIDAALYGMTVDKEKMEETAKNILCQGVGSFSIQGWSDKYQRWIPAIDPYTPGIDDSDFNGSASAIDEADKPYIWYPYVEDPSNSSNSRGEHYITVGGSATALSAAALTCENFNNIPGFGRALKFTFTLYDSRGIYENGKTFSHIVYLND